MSAPRRLMLLLLCMMGWAGCSELRPSQRNLLFISIDTLRADHLSAWGYDRPTSPQIDRLATESVVFERTIAESSWTLATLASVMTSLHSDSHACYGFAWALSDGFDTLAEQLQASDYATGMVASHVFLHPRYGLGQGFEHRETSLVAETRLERHEAITSPRVTELSLDWLRQRADDPRPFFLWAHYFDPHANYQLHEELAERFGGETRVDRYDGEIAYTDDSIGSLLSGLEHLGLTDDTIIVLFADHGEEFLDHGGLLHGRSLYREQLHVPLLFRAPGFPPRRVTSTVTQLDILPTVLELLGLPPNPLAEGRSLVPAMRGQTLDERPILSQLKFNADVHVSALEKEGWKYIVDYKKDTVELYHLETDPFEQRNAADSHPKRVAQMGAELEQRVRAAQSKGRKIARPRRVALPPTERAGLEALGYIESEDQVATPERSRHTPTRKFGPRLQAGGEREE